MRKKRGEVRGRGSFTDWSCVSEFAFWVVTKESPTLLSILSLGTEAKGSEEVLCLIQLIERASVERDN
jgi:hypothetical protein